MESEGEAEADADGDPDGEGDAEGDGLTGTLGFAGGAAGAVGVSSSMPRVCCLPPSFLCCDSSTPPTTAPPSTQTATATPTHLSTPGRRGAAANPKGPGAGVMVNCPGADLAYDRGRPHFMQKCASSRTNGVLQCEQAFMRRSGARDGRTEGGDLDRIDR